jgi:hypothetical protein
VTGNDRERPGSGPSGDEGERVVIVEPDVANPHDEPCLSCGEETAVGSVFYSDRNAALLPDGTPGFLRSECLKRVRSKGSPIQMADIEGVGTPVILFAQGLLPLG